MSEYSPLETQESKTIKAELQEATTGFVELVSHMAKCAEKSIAHDGGRSVTLEIDQESIPLFGITSATIVKDFLDQPVGNRNYYVWSASFHHTIAGSNGEVLGEDSKTITIWSREVDERFQPVAPQGGVSASRNSSRSALDLHASRATLDILSAANDRLREILKQTKIEKK